MHGHLGFWSFQETGEIWSPFFNLVTNRSVSKEFWLKLIPVMWPWASFKTIQGSVSSSLSQVKTDTLVQMTLPPTSCCYLVHSLAGTLAPHSPVPNVWLLLAVANDTQPPDGVFNALVRGTSSSVCRGGEGWWRIWRGKYESQHKHQHNAWHVVGAQQISIESKQHTQLLILISYVLLMTNLWHRIGIVIFTSWMT